MTVDINSLLLRLLSAIKRHPLWVAFVTLRWTLLIVIPAVNFIYFGYVHSGAVSNQLTKDFKKLEETQQSLLNDLIIFQSELLDPNKQVDLAAELAEVKGNAQTTLVSLAGLRAPTTSIYNARLEYQSSLQMLIGVASTIEREGVAEMAPALYEGIQTTANTAGRLRTSIEDFQGGAWPQILGAIF